MGSRQGSGSRGYALTLAYSDQNGVSHRETNRRQQVDSWYELWILPLGFALAGIAGCIGFLVAPPRGGPGGQACWSRTGR